VENALSTLVDETTTVDITSPERRDFIFHFGRGFLFNNHRKRKKKDEKPAGGGCVIQRATKIIIIKPMKYLSARERFSPLLSWKSTHAVLLCTRPKGTIFYN